MTSLTSTNGITVLIDDEDCDSLSQYSWHAQEGPKSSWYFKTSIGGRRNRKNVYLHRLITNAPNGTDVDHRNGDTLDCRKSNLRLCPRSRNNQNRAKTHGKTTSQFKGVFLETRRGRWQAKIQHQRKQIYLGLFSTEEDAALAYNTAAQQLFGEFARLNVVPEAA